MTTIKIRFTDLVRACLPHPATAHSINLDRLTDEMKWLEPCGCAWVIALRGAVVGVLATSDHGWTWAPVQADGSVHCPTFVWRRDEAIMLMRYDVQDAFNTDFHLRYQTQDKLA